MTAPTPNAELAYRVLDHIDAHPEQWLQGRWIGKSDCGTVGCFAGCTVLLSGAEPVELVDDWANTGYAITADVEFEGQSWTVGLLAQHLLRADCWVHEGYDDEEDLFDAANTREDLGRLVEEIFGPRPASFGTGCRCDYLGENTPEHAPGAFCPKPEERTEGGA